MDGAVGQCAEPDRHAAVDQAGNAGGPRAACAAPTACWRTERAWRQKFFSAEAVGRHRAGLHHGRPVAA